MNLLDDLGMVAATDPEGRSRPLANAVHCQDHGIFERRWEEGTGRMTLMVLRK